MNSLFTRVCPALIIALALSACGSSGQTPSTNPTPTVPENGSKPAESKPAEQSDNTTTDNNSAEPPQNTSSENKENNTAETQPQPEDKPTTPPVIIPPAAPPSQQKTSAKKSAALPSNTMNRAPMKFLPIEITMAPALERLEKAITYTPWLLMAKKSNYFLTAQCLAEK
jgi:hypothetical protein